MIVTKLKSTPWNAPELRGSLAGMRYPAFAEIKLDGEFNFIEYTRGGIATVNKYGTCKQDFHELLRMKTILNARGVTRAVMLCELYWGEGKLGALYELLKHKTDNSVNIKVFDVLEYNGAIVSNKNLMERKELLWEMLGDWQVRDKVVLNKEQAKNAFAIAVGHGFEGIVLKSLDSPLTLGPCSWVKMKYKDRTDYKVTDIDESKERLEIIAPLPNGIPRYVGVKAPNRYKKHISVGDTVTIEHQGVLASGSLRHPVLIAKKEWK